VAVLGSVFVSRYAPQVSRIFNRYPIPAGPKTEAHQSMAAALAVVARAPKTIQPILHQAAFSGFESGFKAACLVGGGVGIVGAGVCFKLLSGRGGPGSAEEAARLAWLETSGEPNLAVAVAGVGADAGVGAGVT
jgi:hypothetical protein